MVTVEAGATVPFTVEVTNKGDADRFEIQIEGLDPEWTAVPEPVLSLDAGATQSEKVFFKPSRVPESIAGNYPFAVRVRSLETGESRSVQAVLTIHPFHHVSMDVSPRRGTIAPGRNQNVFTVTLINLGNAEHTFQLFGNDPESAVTFEFEEDTVQVGPGQQRTVDVAVDVANRRFLASPRLFGFSISARSTTVSSVNATAQAQLEQRPLLTVGGFAFLIFTLALLGAWWAMLPKPAKINVFAERSVVNRGEPVRITWQVENAAGVVLRYNDQTVTFQRLSGTHEIPTEGLGGALVVEADAIRDGKTVADATVTVDIEVPDPAPLPKITEFSLDKREVPLGSAFIAKFKFNKAVTRAYLQPLPDPLPLELEQIQVTPTAIGRLVYTLVAQNADGKTVRESRTINVFQKAEAVILDFSSSTNEVGAVEGSVVIRWQTSNARRVTLQATGQDPKAYTGPLADQGEESFFIDRDTKFTLTAFDANGMAISRTLDVKVQKPAPATLPEVPEPFPDRIPPP